MCLLLSHSLHGSASFTKSTSSCCYRNSPKVLLGPHNSYYGHFLPVTHSCGFSMSLSSPGFSHTLAVYFHKDILPITLNMPHPFHEHLVSMYPGFQHYIKCFSTVNFSSPTGYTVESSYLHSKGGETQIGRLLCTLWRSGKAGFQNQSVSKTMLYKKHCATSRCPGLKCACASHDQALSTCADRGQRIEI